MQHYPDHDTRHDDYIIIFQVYRKESFFVLLSRETLGTSFWSCDIANLSFEPKIYKKVNQEVMLSRQYIIIMFILSADLSDISDAVASWSDDA